MTRVLLFGAGGMLGRDLVAEAPRHVELVPRLRQEVDITERASVERAVASTRPNVVINAAAYTNVDAAETEPEKAQQLNGAAPGIVGKAAASVGALVVHYSTDYVFTGRFGRPLREDDAPQPLNQYGVTKLEGERALRASGAQYAIIRTQWLFGIHGRSFPRTVWERAEVRQPTKVVNDHYGRPTYSRDLARATWSLLARSDFSEVVLHVANTGIASWYDVARRIFHAAGADDCLAPCTSAEFPRPACRPAWSALDTSRYQALTGTPLPLWEHALDRFLAELRDARRASSDTVVDRRRR